jgi:putative tryptophan/tyrosine transport system substrate-binding protein
MRRRDFLGVLGGTAATWPLTARGQSDKIRRIGVLMARVEGDPQGQKQYAALQQGLAELHWIEGQTLHIDIRWMAGDPAQALAAAQELIVAKPDLLVANGTPSLVAMRQATSTLPIVFVGVFDPVGQGFVPSLSHPGSNITGFSVEEASMGGKWLEMLREIAPRAAQIAIIYNPDTAPYAPMFLPIMQTAAPTMAVTLAPSPVRTLADIERVIASSGREPGGGLIVLPDSYLLNQRAAIVALAAEHRLPAIYPVLFFAIDGGLIAYGIDRADIFRRAAAYVDRILRGAAPAELPVQLPIKFELGINLQTAKALGLRVPQSLLLGADEVIE